MRTQHPRSWWSWCPRDERQLNRERGEKCNIRLGSNNVLNHLGPHARLTRQLDKFELSGESNTCTTRLQELSLKWSVLVSSITMFSTTTIHRRAILFSIQSTMLMSKQSSFPQHQMMQQQQGQGQFDVAYPQQQQQQQQHMPQPSQHLISSLQHCVSSTASCVQTVSRS